MSEAVRMILNGHTRCPRKAARVSWNVALAWVARARDDNGALALLLDRLEGKVVQPIRSENETAVVFRYEKVPLDVAAGDDATD